MSMHPQNEDLAAYVEAILSPEERSTLEAHLAECRECRTVVTDVSLHLRGEARRRRWIVAAPAAAVAAAAVLALFVVLPTGENRESTPVTTRAGQDHGLESVPAVASLLPDADVHVHPDSVQFLWRSAGPEALYRLALTDSAGGAVWTATTSDTTARPPPEVRLATDHRYFWYVDALLGDGSEASTGVEEFRTRGR